MIKIKSGTFGYFNGKYVEPKTSKSEPFEIDPKREKELVEMGVAEYVGTQEEGVDADEENEDEESVIADDVPITIEFLEGMKLDALKDFAEPYGVEYKVSMKKAEYAQLVFEAIKEQEEEAQDEEQDGEEPPTFDPADALE